MNNLNILNDIEKETIDKIKNKLELINNLNQKIILLLDNYHIIKYVKENNIDEIYLDYQKKENLFNKTLNSLFLTKKSLENNLFLLLENLYLSLGENLSFLEDIKIELDSKNKKIFDEIILKNKDNNEIFNEIRNFIINNDNNNGNLEKNIENKNVIFNKYKSNNIRNLIFKFLKNDFN